MPRTTRRACIVTIAALTAFVLAAAGGALASCAGESAAPTNRIYGYDVALCDSFGRSDAPDTSIARSAAQVPSTATERTESIRSTTTVASVLAAEGAGASKRAIVIGEDMEDCVIPKGRAIGADGVGCAIAAGAAGGITSGALSCPPGASVGKCAVVGGLIGAGTAGLIQGGSTLVRSALSRASTGAAARAGGNIADDLADNVLDDVSGITDDIADDALRGGAPHAASGAAEAVGQARFAPGRWLTHFEKHGASNCWGGNCLGYANSVEYVRGAQNLTRGGSGVEAFVRKSGDTLFYRGATNEFGVLSPDNILRTYFKPDDGYAYWLQQIGGE